MYWIALIAGAVLTLVFVVGKIRANQILTADAVFWFILAVCFVLMAIFPAVVIALSNALGFDSPANFVFLCILAIVIYRQLTASVELARLRSKVVQLTEELALSGVTRGSTVNDADVVQQGSTDKDRATDGKDECAEADECGKLSTAAQTD